MMVDGSPLHKELKEKLYRIVGRTVLLTEGLGLNHVMMIIKNVGLFVEIITKNVLRM